MINPLRANPTKWSNTVKQSVGNSRIDYFVKLALKGLSSILVKQQFQNQRPTTLV